MNITIFNDKDPCYLDDLSPTDTLKDLEAKAGEPFFAFCEDGYQFFYNGKRLPWTSNDTQEFTVAAENDVGNKRIGLYAPVASFYNMLVTDSLDSLVAEVVNDTINVGAAVINLRDNDAQAQLLNADYFPHDMTEKWLSDGRETVFFARRGAATFAFSTNEAAVGSPLLPYSLKAAHHATRAISVLPFAQELTEVDLAAVADEPLEFTVAPAALVDFKLCSNGKIIDVKEFLATPHSLGLAIGAKIQISSSRLGEHPTTLGECGFAKEGTTLYIAPPRIVQVEVFDGKKQQSASSFQFVVKTDADTVDELKRQLSGYISVLPVNMQLRLRETGKNGGTRETKLEDGTKLDKYKFSDSSVLEVLVDYQPTVFAADMTTKFKIYFVSDDDFEIIAGDSAESRPSEASQEMLKTQRSPKAKVVEDLLTDEDEETLAANSSKEKRSLSLSETDSFQTPLNETNRGYPHTGLKTGEKLGDSASGKYSDFVSKTLRGTPKPKDVPSDEESYEEGEAAVDEEQSFVTRSEPDSVNKSTDVDELTEGVESEAEVGELNEQQTEHEEGEEEENGEEGEIVDTPSRPKRLVRRAPTPRFAPTMSSSRLGSSKNGNSNGNSQRDKKEKGKKSDGEKKERSDEESGENETQKRKKRGKKRNSDAEDTPDDYVIERIYGMKKIRSTRWFRVHWKGFNAKDNDTWEKESEIRKSPYVKLLEEFLESREGKPQATTSNKNAKEKDEKRKKEEKRKKAEEEENRKKEEQKKREKEKEEKRRQKEEEDKKKEELRQKRKQEKEEEKRKEEEKKQKEKQEKEKEMQRKEKEKAAKEEERLKKKQLEEREEEERRKLEDAKINRNKGKKTAGDAENGNKDANNNNNANKPRGRSRISASPLPQEKQNEKENEKEKEENRKNSTSNSRKRKNADPEHIHIVEEDDEVVEDVASNTRSKRAKKGDSNTNGSSNNNNVSEEVVSNSRRKKAKTNGSNDSGSNNSKGGNNHHNNVNMNNNDSNDVNNDNDYGDSYNVSYNNPEKVFTTDTFTADDFDPRMVESLTHVRNGNNGLECRLEWKKTEYPQTAAFPEYVLNSVVKHTMPLLLLDFYEARIKFNRQD